MQTGQDFNFVIKLETTTEAKMFRDQLELIKESNRTKEIKDLIEDLDANLELVEAEDWQ